MSDDNETWTLVSPDGFIVERESSIVGGGAKFVITHNCTDYRLAVFSNELPSFIDLLQDAYDQEKEVKEVKDISGLVITDIMKGISGLVITDTTELQKGDYVLETESVGNVPVSSADPLQSAYGRGVEEIDTVPGLSFGEHKLEPLDYSAWPFRSDDDVVELPEPTVFDYAAGYIERVAEQGALKVLEEHAWLPNALRLATVRAAEDEYEYEYLYEKPPFDLSDVREALDGCFIYVDTPEGYEFWEQTRDALSDLIDNGIKTVWPTGGKVR
jgi:hypothetical protein